MRQFYYNMTSLDFERNTRRFLNFLLDNTVIIGSKPNWKLEFPLVENVKLNKSVLRLHQSFYFTDNNQRNLYQGAKIVAHNPISNQQTQDAQKLNVKYRIETRDITNSFLEKIKKELKLNKVVNCAPFFMQIIRETNNINIVVRIAHLLIKEYTKNLQYRLEINNPDSIMLDHLIIWKIIIVKL